MVIVLKNADFSADNVGTIDIVELTPAANAAFLASGRESLSGPQKGAMNDFFALKDTDIWAKLTKVYIPLIGADLAHSFVNYCDENFAMDFNPGSEYFEISNNGIAPKNGEAVAAENGLSLSGFIWNMEDTCVMALQTENIATGALQFMVGAKNSMTSQRVEFTTASSMSAAPAVKMFRSSTAVNTTTTDTYDVVGTPILRGVSTNKVNCHVLTNENKVLESSLGSYTGYTTGIVMHPYASAVEGNVVAGAKAMGLLIIGSYLTKEEMLQVQGLVKSLYLAFKD